MHVKKTKKGDLENKKTIFYQLGFIITLSLVILAFEWKSPLENNIDLLSSNWNPNEIEEIIPTFQKKEKLNLPPPLKTPILHIVEDKIDIEDDLVIDSEITDETINEPDYIYEVPEKKEEEEEIIPFVLCEIKPAFPGGDAAMLKYLYNTIVYPQDARELGIEGTVYVGFVIDPSGIVTNVYLERGIPGLNVAAMDAVKNMPKWKAGKQRNQPISVQYVIPIKFELD